ncbi:MAG: DEAD/DEAH box helicase family protein, partial [Desulfovibrio sp.]|nr:DEAD/DEAH box helicase family protein [Desulfovibrio sp.]
MPEEHTYTFHDACIDISRDCPPDRELGARFERLCAAWLMADPYYAGVLEKVWLWDGFARQLTKDLQPGILSNADQGIDLVAKTRDGEFWAVQCKYYAPDTVMNRGMVDSFVAETGKRFVLADGEHRFARGLWIYSDGRFGPNAEEIMAGQSIPFTKISGWQMAQSEVDWRALVHGTPVHREPKTLLEHQKNALAAAHAHYAEHDRGTLVMACGTGKTFTSLRIVEQELAGKKGALVLFLVPSIALLGQTLNAWMADCAVGRTMKAVCVCSDAKASRKFKEDDAVQDGVMDLAFPASTNAESVYAQLKTFKAGADLIAVFSTYQSIDVVHEAQRLAMERLDGWGVFDFAVCDEAHRTTGAAKGKKVEESPFVRIHDSDFIRAAKRLYMTATPRMYGEATKKKAAEADVLVWSMDDEEVYGKEFFRVNFSYAVQHGLLTDYKVLILTVPASTKGMPEELAAGVENPKTKELNVDLASQLMGTISALSKHIAGDRATWAADPGLMKRGLVFCGLIGKDDQPGSSKNVAFTFAGISERFADMLSKEDKESIVHVQARHVDGSMGADERNAALAWLREESEDPQECRLLCNVRCLSEGIDVPALDAVVYLAPRRSEIDVVQSVGRIMRNFRRGKDGGKKFGYILLPVVVPAGVSPEEALNDNERFQVVW